MRAIRCRLKARLAPRAHPRTRAIFTRACLFVHRATMQARGAVQLACVAEVTLEILTTLTLTFARLHGATIGAPLQIALVAVFAGPSDVTSA